MRTPRARLAPGALTGSVLRGARRRTVTLAVVAVALAGGVAASLLASSGAARPPATIASERITTARLATVRTAMIAKLRAGLVHYSWVTCVRSGARFHGVAVARCNVEFGDPHVQAYCVVFRGGHLVTSEEDPAIPCREDDAGFSIIMQSSP